MQMVIRQAEIKDLRKILDIINHEIINTTVVYDYVERSYDFQLSWFEKKIVDKMPVIVAEKNGEVVGFGSYGIFRPWQAYQFSVEHSIYVDKNFRDSGIGKMLMSTLIQLAKKGGYHTMIAGVDAANAGSIQFHKNFGFTEIGTFKEVGYKFDQWLDLVFLQLILNKVL